MAEDKPNGSQAPLTWGRSPPFRAVTSNRFRYRLASGELTLTFYRFGRHARRCRTGIEEKG
jgi:hypothetical protein